MKKYFFWLGCWALMACDISDNKIEVLDKFVRIYDNATFNRAFTPVDIQQTPDGGYLILGETEISDAVFPGIYLMKVDAEGNFLFDQILPGDFAFPVGDLMKVGEQYYFFCLQSVSLIAHMVSVDAGGQIGTPIPIADAEGNPVYYPMHASLINSNEMLLLGYDKDNQESVLTRLNLSGAVQQKRAYSIGIGGDVDEVEEPIINHFSRNGRKFPFLTGVGPGGQVFFNGFYNFTFSFVLTNLGTEDEPSVLQGVADGAGLSAALFLEGNTYATARFSFGQNYILPQAEIQVGPGNPGSSEDLGGNTFPELNPNATIKLKRLNLAGRDVLLYASDTRAGQIILLAYDTVSGQLIGSTYLGFTNPYEVASFVKTDDEGLAVVGTTYVAGRFPRICLFKLNAEEVGQLLGGA